MEILNEKEREKCIKETEEVLIFDKVKLLLLWSAKLHYIDAYQQKVELSYGSEKRQVMPLDEVYFYKEGTSTPRPLKDKVS